MVWLAVSRALASTELWPSWKLADQLTSATELPRKSERRYRCQGSLNRTFLPYLVVTDLS